MNFFGWLDWFIIAFFSIPVFGHNFTGVQINVPRQESNAKRNIMRPRVRVTPSPRKNSASFSNLYLLAPLIQEAMPELKVTWTCAFSWGFV